MASSFGRSRQCARGLTTVTTRSGMRSIFSEKRFGLRKQITNARLRSSCRVLFPLSSSSSSSSSQKVYHCVFALSDGCSTWMRGSRTASRGRSRRRRLFALHTKPWSRFFRALRRPRSSKLWARTAANGGNIKLQTT